MGIFHGDNLNDAIARELFADISDHYLISEDALIKLDSRPDDIELIHTLFRSVHTIKGDLGIVGFSPAMPLINATEALLERLRSGTLAYNPVISDLILIVLDRIRNLVEGYQRHGYLEYDAVQVTELGERINLAAEQPAEHIVPSLAAIIRQLDPSVAIDSELLPEVKGSTTPQQQLLDSDDLSFFQQLIEPVEARSPYWPGRSERIMKLALILNQAGGEPVEPQQLAVAVYAHDFGMAFMPVELLHKTTTLSDTEIQLLRSHVQSSVQLLQHISTWAGAREIVMQHHEAADGSGYPSGLREKEICEGAKILALADTFDAMTHQRAYPTHQKRPIIRAVKEINGLAGKQLSAHWVEIFNQVVQPILIAHRARHF